MIDNRSWDAVDGWCKYSNVTSSDSKMVCGMRDEDDVVSEK